MSIRKTALALLLVSATLPAMANEGKGFVRGEVGRADLTIEGISDNDTSFGFRGGYFFSPQFAIEGFYSRYGEGSEDLGRIKAHGIGLGVVGKSSFGEGPYQGYFITGRVGAAKNKIEIDIVEWGSFDDSDTNLYVGVGTGYDFNENFGISLNYDYQKPKIFETRMKLETLTLGLEYRF